MTQEPFSGKGEGVGISLRKKREIMCKKSELTKTVSNQHNQNTMKHYVLVAIYYLFGKHSGRLLHFWTLKVGTYLRWVLTWSWMDIEFPPFSASSKYPFDRVPTLCLGGDGLDSCRRLRFFSLSHGCVMLTSPLFMGKWFSLLIWWSMKERQGFP